MRSLLVEDEEELGGVLSAALTRRSCSVDLARTLEEARDYLTLGAFDVIVLDRRLPDGDGLTLLQGRPPTPVLVLTALTGSDQAVYGLESGADDYMAKPFDVDELFARIKALSRRSARLPSAIQTFGNLTFHPDTRSFSIHGAPLAMPRRQLLLLEALLRRAGQVVPHELLEQAVYALDDELGAEAMPPHVSRLRSRLVEASAGVTITAMRGVGYLLHEAKAS